MVGSTGTVQNNGTLKIKMVDKEYRRSPICKNRKKIFLASTNEN
jgi:hypothetical protein